MAEFLLTMTDGTHLRTEADSGDDALKQAREQGLDVATVEPWLSIRHLRTTGLDVGRDALRES